MPASRGASPSLSRHARHKHLEASLGSGRNGNWVHQQSAPGLHAMGVPQRTQVTVASSVIATPPSAPRRHFVDVLQEVGGVVVDAIGAGALQLLAAIAAGEQADAERPRPARGEHVPDAVTDH